MVISAISRLTDVDACLLQDNVTGNSNGCQPGPILTLALTLLGQSPRHLLPLLLT